MIPTAWSKMTKEDAQAMKLPITYIKWIIDRAKEAGYLDLEKEFTQDELDAIHDSNSPSVSNPFATLSDLGTSGLEYIPFVATEDVLAYQPVTSTGQVANSSTIAHRNKVIGIASSNVMNGFSGMARGFGTISNPAWPFTTGDRIFLNGNSLSTTAPSSGFIQILGTMISPTEIDIKISQSILI